MLIKCEPAKTIIIKLKGAARIKRETNIPLSTICAWESDQSGKGAIPRKHWPILKALAAKDGWELNTLHFTGEIKL